MSAEQRWVLLVHVDRAPEFVEMPFVGYVARASNPAVPGSVDYESIGKVSIPTARDDDGLVAEYGWVRAFAHPDLLKEIAERGDRTAVSREIYSPR